MLAIASEAPEAPPDSAGGCRAQTASLKGHSASDAEPLLCMARVWGTDSHAWGSVKWRLEARAFEFDRKKMK